MRLYCRYWVLLNLLLLGFIPLSAQDFGAIEFIENKGQWDSEVKYMGLVSNGAVFLRQGGFTIVQNNPEDAAMIRETMHHGAAQSKSQQAQLIQRSHAWNVDFVGASPKMQIVPEKKIEAYNNYFLGNDPSKWAAECKIYQAVTMQEVYPNVDVRYFTEKGTLKYDIIVKPGGDVSKIALKYDGVDAIKVKNNELVLSTSLGEKRESSPYTYQTGFYERKKINSFYKVDKNIVRFDIKQYDKSTPLVIDPSLIFCSFSGSSQDNWGFTATYGPDGSMFGGGIVFGVGFPTTTGAFQTVYQGGIGSGSEACDIGIIKLTPNGNNRVFATYIGGRGNEQPHSLIVDIDGNLIMAGRSNSDNYPVTNTGETNLSGSGFDIVVTKLNAAGSALIGSKKIGGSGNDGVNITPTRTGPSSLQVNYGDDGRSEVILDGAGNIYVASSTQSNGSFPVTANAFQRNYGGGSQDGVLLKFDPNVSTRLFSSYLGGSNDDAAYVLRLAANGDIYVAGGTASNNLLPGTQAGTIRTTSNGGIDGFIAQISNDGSTVIRSTYIGTASMDQIYGIDLDRNGFVYITGQTRGSWPKIPSNIRTFGNVNGKQFIAKLQPDLSAIVYSTVFGTGQANPNISPTAFMVDRCENVYVSGWGGLNVAGYPSAGTDGLPTTSDAIQNFTDGSDFYFFVMEKNATSQLYGSFFGQFGGDGFDHVDGGTSRFDRNGVIYQGVCANCGTTPHAFPTTPGAWATNKPSGAYCNLAMIKFEMDLSGVGSSVTSSIGGVLRDTAGCLPLTVQFTDEIRNAQSYIWNFGDGTPQTAELPAATGYTQSHTYTTAGTFRVMLIALDPNSCNERDTSYMNIRVGVIEVPPQIGFQKVGDCSSFEYEFSHVGVSFPTHPFRDTSFIWNINNGASIVRNNGGPIRFTFPGPGTYPVVLQLVDTTYCNAPESDTLMLQVVERVIANFEMPLSDCAPLTLTFANTSEGGVTWQWNFGDGTPTSSDFEPEHTFTSPGVYTVELVAFDPNSCNGTDTIRKQIDLRPRPTASFTVDAIDADVNQPHSFFNNSSFDATLFKWYFGDGDSLITTSRDRVIHQYNQTGSYEACLVAFNDIGCSDTVCVTVRATIIPQVDVPTAFTPNSGDINSIVMVRGFGIAKMRFTIWNRWGQKVFETENRLQGWDGKVNGKLQPMDVYAYTLEVEFGDGTKASRRGDITLIR